MADADVPAAEGRLFDADLLKRIEALSIVVHKSLAGRHAGHRRSPRKGSSVEFADFRNYTAGDDFRQVDWNAYARFERLYLKLFMEEQDTTIHAFVDTSASMTWGKPSKARLARQMAGALAYLGLTSFDQVGLGGLGRGLDRYYPPVRGRGEIWRIFQFLEYLPDAGETDLGRSLKEFGRYRRGPGIAFVISDLLTPLGYRDGLNYLRFLGQEVFVIQVLSSDELAPEIAGDARLTDVETGQFQDVSATPGLIRAYRERLTAYVNEVRDFCRRHEIGFWQVSSDEKADEVIAKSLRRAGIVR
ncbi:MAG TPA: DUF58 domain-containing protein [Bacillota bacterium]